MTMDLRDRLLRAGLVGDASARRGDSPESPDPPLDTLIAGEWVLSSNSRCFVVEEHYPLDHRHGLFPLAELLSWSPDALSPFLAGTGDQSFDPRHALFLDAETTGLARTAGTFVFLVGVGYFTEDSFCVRQYFVPDYADEDALLDLLAHDFASHRGLVTFNGRAFDWPLIANRYILAKREIPSNDSPHLDLLYAARRLWRRLLDSCALSSLESHVLDIVRTTQDVPGWEIPRLYQEYLALGRTEPLVGVFYHNAVDILSLVSLTTRLSRCLSNPFGVEEDDFRDYVALGRLFRELERVQDAVQAYRKGMTSTDETTRDLAHKQLSFFLKRLGRHEEAMELWQAQLGGRELYPYVELAKQFEHRLRDYPTAAKITEEALSWLQSHAEHLTSAKLGLLHDKLLHRLGRLRRRMSLQSRN